MTFRPDPVVENWVSRAPQQSQHLALEVAAAHRRGRPLGMYEPVAGCVCLLCATLAAGGMPDDAESAELVVKRLATRPPKERRREAEILRGRFLGRGINLPSAWALYRAAGRVPGAVRAADDERQPLPVETARAVPILEVCDRLGLELRKVGTSWRGPCPLHGGNGPNFSVDAKRGVFKCFVCDEGGDAIDLWERMRGVGFVNAVREMVASRPSGSPGGTVGL